MCVTSLTDLFCITSVFFERLSKKRKLFFSQKVDKKLMQIQHQRLIGLSIGLFIYYSRTKKFNILLPKKLIFSLVNRTTILEKYISLHLSDSLNPSTNLKLHFSQIPYHIRFCRTKNELSNK